MTLSCICRTWRSGNPKHIFYFKADLDQCWWLEMLGVCFWALCYSAQVAKSDRSINGFIRFWQVKIALMEHQRRLLTMLWHFLTPPENPCNRIQWSLLRLNVISVQKYARIEKESNFKWFSDKIMLTAMN